MPAVARFQAEIDVPLPPEQSYDLWIDASRFPQWQRMVIRAFDATGDVDVPGATYRLDHGPRMKRTITVLGARRPEMYRIRQQGAGQDDEGTTTFELTADGGTRLRVDWHVRLRMGPVGWAMERFGRGRMERELETELQRFVALATRPQAEARPRSLYSVDCTAGYRVVHVLGADERLVHLRLLPTSVKDRPTDARIFLEAPSRLADPFLVQELDPRWSNVGSDKVSGQRLLALDGGIGVPHLALTRGCFTDALPVPIGELDVPSDASAQIAAWQAVDGPLGGRDLDFGVAPVVTFAMEQEEYAVAKILRGEMRTVHLRLYSDRWPEPPSDVNPFALRLDPAWAPNPGIVYMPVARYAFSDWKPAFLRLAMLAPGELDGYRHWKAEGGGVFG